MQIRNDWTKEEISEKLYTKNVMTFLKQKTVFSPLKENFQNFLKDDQRLELQSNLIIYPQSFYKQNLCSSLFPLFKQKNDFTFLQSSTMDGKFHFFENFQEKLSKKFFHLSHIQERGGAYKSFFSNFSKMSKLFKNFSFLHYIFYEKKFYYSPFQLQVFETNKMIPQLFNLNIVLCY